MQVAFKIADCALPRRVVAKRNVHVRIDEPGDRGHAASIDHDISILDVLCRGGADACQAIAIGKDGIAWDERIAPIAGNYLSELTIAIFTAPASRQCFTWLSSVCRS